MMAKPAICAQGPPGAIAPNAVRAIEVTSDPELRLRRLRPWVVDLRENNLAVLTRLRLELAEIVQAINCFATQKF
jgi:hypothetical protein